MENEKKTNEQLAEELVNAAESCYDNRKSFTEECRKAQIREVLDDLRAQIVKEEEKNAHWGSPKKAWFDKTEFAISNTVHLKDSQVYPDVLEGIKSLFKKYDSITIKLVDKSDADDAAIEYTLTYTKMEADEADAYAADKQLAE